MNHLMHDIPTPDEMRKSSGSGKKMILAHMAPDELEFLQHLQGHGRKSNSQVPDLSEAWKFIQNPNIQQHMRHSAQDGYHGSHHLPAHLQHLKASGRAGDTELVQMPEKMSHFLDSIIGGPSVNPHTGKHEYFLGSALSGLSGILGSLASKAGPMLGRLASSAGPMLGKLASSASGLFGRAAGAASSGLSSAASSIGGGLSRAASGMASHLPYLPRFSAGAQPQQQLPAPAAMPPQQEAAPQQSWSDWAGGHGRSIGSGVGSSVGRTVGTMAGGQLGSSGAGSLVRNFVPGGGILQYPARLAGGLGGGMLGGEIGQRLGSGAGGNIGHRIGSGVGSAIDYGSGYIPGPVKSAYNSLPSMQTVRDNFNYYDPIPRMVSMSMNRPPVQDDEDEFHDQDEDAYNSYRPQPRSRRNSFSPRIEELD